MPCAAQRRASHRTAAPTARGECQASVTGIRQSGHVKRIERIRLYPTTRQRERLRFMLDVTRELYNALLQERKDAYRLRAVRITGKQQYADLTALRKPVYRIDGRLAAVYRECEDAVLHRLDLAMQAFFRRIARGETPGFPRFKSRVRWAQIEFPHGDRALKFNAPQTKVIVPGIGGVRLRKGRQVPAFGRAWLVRKNARWYACFECERAATRTERASGVVGIDRGVHVLAATSDGRLFPNVRPDEQTRLRVERAQRAVSRRKRGGKNRRRAVQALARIKERVANVRLDHAHQVARQIVDSAPSVIAMEALCLRSMTRSAKGSIEQPGSSVRQKAGLNRAILDAGFGLLQRMIVAKAEEAGLAVVAVDPKCSSQECSQCGHVAKESRARRRYRCVRCGFSTHADVNAALVIARRAQLAPVGRGGALAHLDDLRRLPDAGAEPVTQYDVA